MADTRATAPCTAGSSGRCLQLGSRLQESLPVTSLPISVKNTFIDMSTPNDEASSVRRSSSMPAALRIAGYAVTDADDRCSDGAKVDDMDGQVGSDGSTEDLRTEVSDDDISNRNQPGYAATEVSDDDLSTQSPPGNLEQPDTASVSEDDASTQSIPSSTAGSSKPPVFSTLPPPPRQAVEDENPAPRRSRLSPKAEAWVPGAKQERPEILVTRPGGTWNPSPSQQAPLPFQSFVQPAVDDGAPTQFFQEALQAVSTVKAALQSWPCSRNLEVTGHAQGWIICIKVRAEDVPRAEYILKMAKEHLLWSTNDSPSLRVIGHRLAPFVSSPLSFTATLGAVLDDSKACYEAYGKGFCRRGHACRWQHPPCTKSIQVAVVGPPVRSR
mmetsp:Transcript_86730/g.273627  ORF Transcript_86730/g.273627 Transcript_86730/m.273627 type:complete len:384 (+) Transcript_86730:133-1284(+)